ncbi:MAG: biotin carboxylase [Xanthomonadaceae bacterium]|nr:biotin carboxylase [Xanthomonadaceae bacterium]
MSADPDIRGWPFQSVLVANRGEIALRVLRSVQRLGLRGIVVFHAADRATPAVAMADAAIEIHGATPVAAYLDGEQILAAARHSGAGAIHPGYGFLSENAGFCAAVEAAGLVFIGPTPAQIRLMGDKVRARNFVAEAGFPVAPSAIEDDDPASFADRARAVGVPLLIKPSAGGGGKGMRIVRDLALLDAEIARARSEGQRYFGDGRLYVERYIEQPRHIEVQVLGDAHGEVVHLFERECSVQRRFQKIVEETPSPALTPELRQRICDTAAGIARSAGYRNAGTVEFIFGHGGASDGDSDGDGKDAGAARFYFLEMNTRLQVEHPVTEAITGIDLVQEQLRIAAGEPLGYGQAAITAQGHAIEFRIYAEDPARGYTPTTGPILRLRPPAGDGLRWDGGVREGGEVTAAFDPMIAKLIVHGADRGSAIARADRALRDTVLLGCQTNVAFLRRLIADPAFVAGDIHTGFLDAHPEIAADPPLDADRCRALLAAAALATRPLRDAADAVPALHAAIGPWSNGTSTGLLPTLQQHFHLGDQAHAVALAPTADGHRLHDSRGSAAVALAVDSLGDGELCLDGRRLPVQLAVRGDEVFVHLDGAAQALRYQHPLQRLAAAGQGGAEDSVRAPMPGSVVSLPVTVGAAVQRGDILLVMESMKMETTITAPRDGVVEALHYAVGQSFDRDALLLELSRAD